MKKIHSWRRVMHVLAISVIALSGMLLVQHMASADNGIQKMEPVYRNYDWGWSRPGGQYSEDLHREHLNDNFQIWASQQDQRFVFVISIPDTLEIVDDYNDPETVDYSLESVFHKYVDSKEDCDQERSSDSVQLETIEREGIANAYAGLTVDNEDQYSCLTVKLKGRMDGNFIRVHFDTHPEWTFVSEPIEWVAGYPSMTVTSGFWGAKAYSPDRNENRIYNFKYRVLDEDANCDSSVFAVAPNHPSVHHSDMLWRPKSEAVLNSYNGRVVCFQASLYDPDIGKYLYLHKRSAPLQF